MSWSRALPWKGLLLPAVFLAVMEIWFHASSIATDTLAAPSRVIVAFVGAMASGEIMTATMHTLGGAFGGLLIGSTIGLLLGILFGLVPILDRLMEVTVEALRPIPSVALLPIALMVFGFGFGMEFAIVGKSCLFVTMILTRAAVRGIEPRLIEVSRMLGLTTAARVRKIVIPAILPRLFVTFRLVASLALVISITVEIAVNPQGLGFAIMTAQQALRPELMLAYFIWIGAVGLALNSGLLLIQRKLFGRMAALEDAA
jgi:sulfonate transport system permease protein